MSTTDYKSSLNLPKTDFPMKANLANREKDQLQKWQDIDLYNTIKIKNKNRNKFVLHDGPPYANGSIHIGHAVNKIVKDIILKAKLMSNYAANLVPGWDCHGLPIELQVEKKHGKPSSSLSPNEFRQKCREYAQQQVAIQKKDFIRLGVLADWDKPYLTMQPTVEAATIDGLAKIIANNHIYQGVKPVHWCLNCQSSLAEAEVEHQPKKSTAIDLAFKLVKPAKLLALIAPQYKLTTSVYLPIWTTTPWTIPANQAIAVNPKLTYVITQDKDKILILNQKLLANSEQRYGNKKLTIIGQCLGEDLAGEICWHPLEERQVPVVLSDHVTTENGTGVVHIAPAHGMDDYTIGLKYDLEIKTPVDARGIFNSSIDSLNGQHITKADNIVCDLLTAKGSLLSKQQIEHSYPHCWRHKQPIIFRATAQWFISMHQAKLKHKSLAKIEQINFLPSWGKDRIKKMISDRPDWCISRQRCWGTPIPLFIHKLTHELHPQTKIFIAAISKEISLHGIDYWFNLDKKAILGKESEEYIKITDTLDVWFDSGVTHHSVVQTHPDLALPADLYVEGSDQHRGWFQSSLLTSLAINNIAPYKSVLTHGFVVDHKGHKMSKSVGNVISPQQIVNTYGADILRLWTASCDLSHEMTIADKILKNTSDIYRRIRNTARFMLANLHDFDPQINQIDFSNLLVLDKWIIDKTLHIQQQIIAAYNSYDLAKAANTIHNFCALELSSYYLDIIKDRQYTLAPQSHARLSGQTAVYHVLLALTKWIAPILSFTAEEIYQHIPGHKEDSIFFTLWHDKLEPLLQDEKSMHNSYWQEIMQLRTRVNQDLEKSRINGIIGSPLDASITIYCANKLYKNLTLLGNELKFILLVSQVNLHLHPDAPGQASLDAKNKIQVIISKSSASKCSRCWHRCKTIGENDAHPSICARCITNITTLDGEIRLYA